MCILAMAFAASLTSPSEGTNSVYAIDAPHSRHMILNEASVTSSMGASSTGLSPRSMFPIFIFWNCLSTDAKISISSVIRKRIALRQDLTGRHLYEKW